MRTGNEALRGGRWVRTAAGVQVWRQYREDLGYECGIVGCTATHLLFDGTVQRRAA